MYSDTNIKLQILSFYILKRILEKIGIIIICVPIPIHEEKNQFIFLLT